MMTEAFPRTGESQIGQRNDCARPWWRVFTCLALMPFVYFFWCVGDSPAARFEISSIRPPPQKGSSSKMPGQLPHSRVARGSRDIVVAWLADPTDRYQHDVLGDDLEATKLMVETSTGKRLQVDLPPTRVFEDLQPRIVDIDGDGREEIIVVESDRFLGASLAVYGIVDDRLARIAATAFLGRPYRWLNPLGVGDFNGDGKLDVALVATPHIGGILRLYRFKIGKLSLFAEYPGVSTHQMGSTELGLGRVVANRPRDQLLVPTQTRKAMMLLEWSPDGLQVVARVELPGRLASSLTPTDDGKWRFHVEDGRHFAVQIHR